MEEVFFLISYPYHSMYIYIYTCIHTCISYYGIFPYILAYLHAFLLQKKSACPMHGDIIVEFNIDPLKIAGAI